MHVAGLIREIAEHGRLYNEASRLWGENKTEINKSIHIIVNDIIERSSGLLYSFNDAFNTDEMMFYDEIFNTDAEIEIESVSGDEELVFTDSTERRCFLQIWQNILQITQRIS